jgi:hypothetical protein
VRVQNLKRMIAARDAQEEEDGSELPPTASSGYRLWHAILSSAKCGVGPKRQERINDFMRRVYFNGLGDMDAYEQGTNDLRDDHKLLPSFR